MSPLRSVAGLGHSRLIPDISVIGITFVVGPPPPVTSATACKQRKEDSDKEGDGSGKNQPCRNTVGCTCAETVVVDGISDDTKDRKVED